MTSQVARRHEKLAPESNVEFMAPMSGAGFWSVCQGPYTLTTLDADDALNDCIVQCVAEQYLCHNEQVDDSLLYVGERAALKQNSFCIAYID